MRGYEDVPENELKDFIFHNLRLCKVEHLGRRSKKKDPIAPLDRFMMYHPIEEWKNTVSRLGKASKEKAIELVILEYRNIEQTRSSVGFYNSLIVQHQI